MVSVPITVQILLILALILANGAFAMAEIAIVSSRKARLEEHARAGRSEARLALELAEQPNRFLSTVQIGITLVGIFAGAYGGATLAVHLEDALDDVPALAPWSGGLALTLVVAAITYLSLVLGELVPKRIGLTRPESIAMRVARPMLLISRAALPVVKLLGASTEGVLRVLRVKKSDEPPVTESEISALLRQGAEAGVFEEDEREIVDRVFSLADRRVRELMTPRRRVVYLDLRDPIEANRAKLSQHHHSRYPVVEGGLDHVVGIVDARDLLGPALAGGALEIRRLLRPPLYVPETLRALPLLRRFRESGIHAALVIDEHGGIEGMVTLNDVLEEISGDLIPAAAPPAVEREDGSWLVDASMSIVEFHEHTGLGGGLATDPQREYDTLGGLVVTHLGHVPQPGQSVQAAGLRVEVVDMDGHRVDKVIVTALARQDPDEDIGS